MDVNQPIQKFVRSLRVAGHEHQEFIHAVEPLTGLQQIAAKKPDNRAVRVGAEPFRPFREGELSVRSRSQRTGSRGDAAPHVVVECFR